MCGDAPLRVCLYAGGWVGGGIPIHKSRPLYSGYKMNRQAGFVSG